MAIKVFKNLIIVSAEDRMIVCNGPKYDHIDNFRNFLKFHGIEFTEGRTDKYRDNDGVMFEHQAFVLDDASMTAYRLVKE